MGGRRRNRQPDASVRDASEDSSESGDKTNSGDNCPARGKELCPHIKLAVRKSKVLLNNKKSILQIECEDCKKLGCDNLPTDDEELSPMPLWMCLYCGHQACGRGQKLHAMEHYKSARDGHHSVVVNTQKWNVWCYPCDTEITGPHSRKIRGFLDVLKKFNPTSLTATVSENSKETGTLLSPLSQRAIPLPFIQTNLDNENVDKSNLPLNGLTKVVGLSNLGNTCFFNAVLQCLAQTPFLVKVLEDLQEPGEKFTLPGGKCKVSEDSEEIELPPIEGTLQGWGPFTSILCKTLKAMQSMKTRQVYVPNELLASFRKKTIQCMDGGQHDSHELLRHLLEIVRNEDLRRYQSVILKEIGIGVSIKANCANDSDKAQVKFYGRQAGSRLLGSEPVFRGVLVSTLKCLECFHSSQRTEAFLDLSLPVMSEKPQSPVVKKHKGFDESFDSMGNTISSVSPMKDQFRKEEKRPELTKKQMKLRMKDRGNNHWGYKSNANKISEEKQSSTLESEGDADVEDNVSALEVIESGYSSEKASALTSPASPGDDDLSKSSFSQSDANVTLSNGNLPSSPIDSFPEPMTPSYDDNCMNQEFNGLNRTDISLNLNQDVFPPSTSNWADSPITEATNEIGDYAGVSPSTSLIVNSELSPEGATISSISSPITSKDSPTPPPTGASREKIDGLYDLFRNAIDDTVPTVLNESESLNDTLSRKLEMTEVHTPENQMPDNQEGESTTSLIEQPEIKSENGVTEITEGLAKVGVSTHSHSHGYNLKSGDCSIQSCLNQFTAVELLSGSNKVCCEACTARENKGKEGPPKMVCTSSSKQYLISQVPAILILHLKRFQSLRMSFRKVPKHVKFPLLLDLAPVCTESERRKVYSLYGIVEHSGTLHGGHYVAYVKTRAPLTPDDPRWAFLPSKDSTESAENSNVEASESETEETKANSEVQPPPGHWYHISDSRVVEVDEATVLRTQAYMLFYERIL
ncbi:ubiquitin carboxyl-terminal hydrolase 16 isoform X2 [Venturia canescens]|uniref:ubiquitin carboxyl-terminal hydrolase 16 isoform X2 n=1 Tax=Venturia canescens TaxID=32260 RepID=UPI001C9D57AF|nr:ubiquitin carboxyl-terminal hydrolase 16 isoform X2 [Venturia canescens]